MWTKEFLSEEQLAFYKLHPWYYAEFEKFSIRTSNIIELYKSREGYRKFLPPYVGISLTYKCNLTCKMCFQDDRSKYEHEMSTDKLIEIADEIKDWETFPWVTLWGGEPLLNKNFRTVYERFQEAAGVVTILTNGVLLHHYLDLISD
ncbi:MAG: radical SAM protein, partial [Bacteroidota bacterium]